MVDQQGAPYSMTWELAAAKARIKPLEAEIERLKKKLALAIAQDYCTMCGKTLDGYMPGGE